MDLDDDFKFEHFDFEVMLGFHAGRVLVGHGRACLETARG